MRRSRKKSFLNIVSVVFLAAAFVSGCAPKAVRQPGGAMDTPEHHVFSGTKAMDRGDYEASLREFKLALELDPRYSPAHRGLGITLGHKKDFGAAFESMSSAMRYARTKEDKGMADVGFMRLLTLQKEKGWLEKVEEHFRSAVAQVEALPEAYFYMGKAFKDGYRFREADGQFKKVLAINKGLVKEADEELKVVQKVERAMPGSEVGKKVALQEKLTRADCAAIFVHELRLEKIYEKGKGSFPALKSIPDDIKDSILRADIEAVIRIGLRGLEIFPDGGFHPGAFVSRAAYAMMIEDIIGTITHDRALSTKHIGQPSSFPDVRSDAAYFNAVMVCTTRGIMESDNIITGNFSPEGQISGADALLVIRKLKEHLKVF